MRHPLDSVSRLATDISPNVKEQFELKDDLTDWIDSLELYECRNCPVGFSKIDTNGLLSYGCLQFQMPTFKQYVKFFYGDLDLEEADWENLIHSCKFQKGLAYKMISYNPEKWVHWQTSVKRGLGLPPEVP